MEKLLRCRDPFEDADLTERPLQVYFVQILLIANITSLYNKYATHGQVKFLQRRQCFHNSSLPQANEM